MFWNLKLNPDSKESIVVDQKLRLTFVVVDLRSFERGDEEINQVIITPTSGVGFLLANISARTPHVVCDVQFKQEEITFENIGTGIVHIAGVQEETGEIKKIKIESSSSDTESTSSATTTSEEEPAAYSRKK